MKYARMAAMAALVVLSVICINVVGNAIGIAYDVAKGIKPMEALDTIWWQAMTAAGWLVIVTCWVDVVLRKKRAMNRLTRHHRQSTYVDPPWRNFWSLSRKAQLVACVRWALESTGFSPSWGEDLLDLRVQNFDPISVRRALRDEGVAFNDFHAICGMDPVTKEDVEMVTFEVGDETFTVYPA